MHYPAFFHQFSEMFTSDTGTGKKGIFLPVHNSRETQSSGIEESPGYHPVGERL
jgi:hypothetical protein